jgi:hypothetical protein
MDITSFVGKLLEQDDVDALREGVKVLAQAVMETEVSGQIGAAPYERSSERIAYRNGYRTRRWDTRVGTIELKISHRRRLLPSCSSPPACQKARTRRRRGQCEGMSTRKVDDLVRALDRRDQRSEVSDCKCWTRRCSVLPGRSRPVPLRVAGCHPQGEELAGDLGRDRGRDRCGNGSARCCPGPSEDHQFLTFLRRSSSEG